MPRSGWLNGVSRKTASPLKTEQMTSTSPRSHPWPNVSTSARNAAAAVSLIGTIYLLALGGCRNPEPRGATLLFLGRFPAARLGELSWGPDPARSRLVAFDRRLRIVRVIADPRLASPVAVARWDGRLLVTERTGEGLIVDPHDGEGRVVREWPGPFPASLHATNDDHIVASRSPYFVQFIGEDGSAPLFWMLDTLGRPAHGPGTIHVPRVAYLTQLVNAGPLALGHDAIYFAPLVRDEIIRYDATGYPVWRTSRGMFAKETDPVFPPGQTRPIRVAYANVNVALAMAPNGVLYVLGSEDSAGTTLRLDGLDTATGRIIERRTLGARDAAVAIEPDGAIRILDLDTLLAQSPTSGREEFSPAFALRSLTGDTVRLAQYRGKITLVNFWASWCDPCREEFPHMAELYRDLPPTDFAIAAISDDVSEAQMLGFVRQFRPPFPILAGEGRMKATYHYRGLPYSVLLDREGRVVQRIFGFGGESEFRRLRETIANAIAVPYP
jgi:thiol-disulfide isomerase/thioredoxin